MLQRSMHGKKLIYLDSAATAQKPSSVIDRMNRFYEHEYATVHRAAYQLSINATEELHRTRCTVQKFINARRAEEIIFTRGTTDALNLLAFTFGERFLEKGDEILLSEMEHHSNIVPWQLAAKRRGALIRVIPLNAEGMLDMEAFETLLSRKTKIVSITHISNVLGTINPLREIVEKAHAQGAFVAVDGAQSAPHMPVDVQALDLDFYAFSGHKCYGPTGVGILYGKEELLEALPPYQGGSDMIDRVTFEETSFALPPLKFETGTPMIAEIIGLKAALDYIEAMGRDKIEEKEQKLLLKMERALSEIKGISILSRAPKKSAILSFTIDKLHPLDIGTFLSLEGVAVRTGHSCAQPLLKKLGVESVVRASLGLYNTEDDVEQFAAALEKVVTLLNRASCAS